MKQPPDRTSLSWPAAGLGIVLGLVVLEGMSLLGLALLPRLSNIEIRKKADLLDHQVELAQGLLASPDGRNALDPELGWIYRPGFASDSDAVNDLGARSARSYGSDPPERTLRVTAFGDSFMYGNEVSVYEVWSTLLENASPDLEVLNFGVGGYGTDQAFLRYLRERDEVGGEVVLIGFAPVNLRRAVNVYRRFVADGELALVKPRFKLADDGTLELIPNPLPSPQDYRRLVEDPRETLLELGTHDFWFEPLIWRNPLYDLSGAVRLVSHLGARVYRTRLSPDRILRGGLFNSDSEAFRVQTRILLDFVDSVSVAGAHPEVVIFPDRGSIEQFRNGRPTIYASLVRQLNASGVEPLDLVQAFAEAIGEGDLGPWFAPGGHYSAQGNRVVADAIGQALSELEIRRSYR